MAQVQGGKRKSADGANARKRKNGTFAGSLFYASSAPVQSREYDAARNRKANADRMGLAAVTSSVHTQACGAKQLPAMDSRRMWIRFAAKFAGSRQGKW